VPHFLISWHFESRDFVRLSAAQTRQTMMNSLRLLRTSDELNACYYHNFIVIVEGLMGGEARTLLLVCFFASTPADNFLYAWVTHRNALAVLALSR
jgi:hypothetical protein